MPLHSNLPASEIDVICLSHLRWDFVYQRPQHLLSRCARERRVFFFEEPIFDEAVPRLDLQKRGENLWVVTPHIQNGLAEERINIVLQSLIYDLIATQRVNKYLLWYYTPMALSFTHQLNPQSVIYDCMDELSAFKGAPAVMRRRVMTLPARFRLSAQPVRTE